MSSFQNYHLMKIFAVLGLLPSVSSIIPPDLHKLHLEIEPLDPVTDHTLEPNTKDHYSGLFQSEDTIKKLVAYRSIEDNYKVRAAKEYSFEGTCNSFHNEYSTFHRLPTCSSTAFQEKGNVDPCCRTKMSLIIPSTVVSVYSGTEYNVTHYQSSYQLLHQGKCSNHGASCYVSGKCRQSYRMHWMLVDMPDGTESFVPVRIPNHCYCGY